MALLALFILAVILARHYMREGLFPGAANLVCVFVACVTGLAFGPVVAGLIDVASPYRYGATIAAVGVVSMGALRAFLGPLNLDVDFHPAVDRVGGVLTGAAAGVMIGGFIAVCLLCLNLAPLAGRTDALRQAGSAVVAPCRLVAAIAPGRYAFDLDSLLNPNPARSATVPNSPVSGTPEAAGIRPADVAPPP